MRVRCHDPSLQVPGNTRPELNPTVQSLKLRDGILQHVWVHATDLAELLRGAAA